MENEITGFHAAQRFIEPQNHQRFVSTPMERVRLQQTILRIKQCMLPRRGNQDLGIEGGQEQQFFSSVLVEVLLILL